MSRSSVLSLLRSLPLHLSRSAQPGPATRGLAPGLQQALWPLMRHPGTDWLAACSFSSIPGLPQASCGHAGPFRPNTLASMQGDSAVSMPCGALEGCPTTHSQSSSFSTQSQDSMMHLANALAMPAASLTYERDAIKLPQPLDNKMGRLLLTVLGFYSHQSQLLHGGQELYQAIKEQCDDGALVEAFDLDPKVFFSTYTLLSLHVWLLVHRLGHRNDKDTRKFKQRFYTLFQNDVDSRVHRAGVQVGVSKWLKQLETVFYSSGMALDKVLSGESQESFTDVVLRHFMGGDDSKRGQADIIAKYIQRELHCLQLTEDRYILLGHIQFSQEPFERFRSAAKDRADNVALLQEEASPVKTGRAEEEQEGRT